MPTKEQKQGMPGNEARIAYLRCNFKVIMVCEKHNSGVPCYQKEFQCVQKWFLLRHCDNDCERDEHTLIQVSLHAQIMNNFMQFQHIIGSENMERKYPSALLWSHSYFQPKTIFKIHAIKEVHQSSPIKTIVILTAPHIQE